MNVVGSGFELCASAKYQLKPFLLRPALASDVSVTGKIEAPCSLLQGIFEM
jgi:hypothetical protein